MALASPRTSAHIIPLPGAAIAPVVNPKRRGRLPGGVRRLDAIHSIRFERSLALLPKVADLPFVADVLVPGTKRTKRRCFWHVAPGSDYFAASETGTSYARAYLAYIASGGDSAILTWVVRDMMKAPQDDAASGYHAGFWAEIGRAAKSAVAATKERAHV